MALPLQSPAGPHFLAAARILRSSTAGDLDPRVYANLDRFTVTFDAPNYVYLDDIIVEVTGGTAPAVAQTLRLNNGDPEVVEIVFDGPLPPNEATRFVFNDGETVNVITYTLGELPPIPPPPNGVSG